MIDGRHQARDMMKLMAAKIDSIAGRVSDEDVAGFIDELLSAHRIFVIGAGRSGLVAKAFAMRLMHLGLTTFVVGETITPAVGEGDTIVAFSGSGNTKTVAELVEKASEIGATVCLITSRRDSRMGRIADRIVEIESQRDPVTDESMEFEIRQMIGEHKSFAPLGTLFETASMVFADAVISCLMQITRTEESELQRRHTNIE